MVLCGQSIWDRKPIRDMQQRSTFPLYSGVNTTYGLGPAGYDLRLDEVEGYAKGERVFVLAPGQFVLASAMEQFQMPDDLLGVVHDKSTLARLGLAVQNTVIEPGWRGYLTLELTNHSDEPLTLIRGIGICQVIFHLLDAPSSVAYDGKYQDQERGPQGAR